MFKVVKLFSEMLYGPTILGELRKNSRVTTPVVLFFGLTSVAFRRFIKYVGSKVGLDAGGWVTTWAAPLRITAETSIMLQTAAADAIQKYLFLFILHLSLLGRLGNLKLCGYYVLITIKAFTVCLY